MGGVTIGLKNLKQQPNGMSFKADNNLTQPENHAFVNMKFEFEKNSFSLPKGFKRAKDIHFSPLQLSKVK